MANTLPFLLLPKGLAFKQFLRDAAFTDRLAVLQRLSEDAPQVTNRVDLGPDGRDGLGLPVARITYSNPAFELSAARFYAEKMLDIHRAAGAELGFSVPLTLTQQGVASQGATRHIMGTLRMGNDARTSVCNADGRFHEIDNLYAADGSLLPTSSGYNQTLTIEALAARVAGAIAEPGHPQRVLGRSRPDCHQAATGGRNC